MRKQPGFREREAHSGHHCTPFALTLQDLSQRQSPGALYEARTESLMTTKEVCTLQMRHCSP